MTSKRLTTLEIHRAEMKFSAGHFTLFSATEREHLHGHNYTVALAITHWLSEHGMNFDYRYYRERICELCAQLDHRTLLPIHSPHLKIEEAGDYHHVYFSDEKLIFLRKDIVLLPITNSTIEELSNWFLQELLKAQQVMQQHKITTLTVKVANGPGQSAATTWDL